MPNPGPLGRREPQMIPELIQGHTMVRKLVSHLRGAQPVLGSASRTPQRPATLKSCLMLQKFGVYFTCFRMLGRNGAIHSQTEREK